MLALSVISSCPVNLIYHILHRIVRKEVIAIQIVTSFNIVTVFPTNILFDLFEGILSRVNPLHVIFSLNILLQLQITIPNFVISSGSLLMFYSKLLI